MSNESLPTKFAHMVSGNIFRSKEGEDVKDSKSNFPIMMATEKTIENKMVMKCKCGHVHFRHGGYTITATPWAETKPDSGPEGHVSTRRKEIWFCIKCKTPYSIENGTMYDWSNYISFEDWEAFEKEAHKATGPGGEC